MNFFRHPTTVAFSSVEDAASSEANDPCESSSSSFDHSVNKQNSSPTRQISPVRLHTQVGVPLKEISFSSSYNTKNRWLAMGGGERRDPVRLTNSERWKHFSTKTSSSSDRGI